MPRKPYVACRRCGTESKPLSRRGNCEECALELMRQGATMMADKSGPVYNTWLERMREVLDAL